MSEWLGYVTIISKISDETIIQAIAEFKNLLVVVVVRVVWAGLEWLYKRIFKTKKK